jgi:acyl-CoA thioester hydrolase
MDNDAYGHVNNVVYYSFFDTVVNRWLIERGALDIECRRRDRPGDRDALQLLRAAVVPAGREAGLRVAHVGSSSVRYEVGLFAEGAPTSAALPATSCMSTSTVPHAPPGETPRGPEGRPATLVSIRS